MSDALPLRDQSDLREALSALDKDDLVDRLLQEDSFQSAIAAGERSHLLTIGSPARGLAFRVTIGRLSRHGRWHDWQPSMFWIWRGRRV